MLLMEKSLLECKSTKFPEVDDPAKAATDTELAKRIQAYFSIFECI